VGPWIVPGRCKARCARRSRLKAPALIEVRIDGMISPPLGDRAKSIAASRGKSDGAKGRSKTRRGRSRSRGMWWIRTTRVALRGSMGMTFTTNLRAELSFAEVVLTSLTGEAPSREAGRAFEIVDDIPRAHVDRVGAAARRDAGADVRARRRGVLAWRCLAFDGAGARLRPRRESAELLTWMRGPEPRARLIIRGRQRARRRRGARAGREAS